MAKLIHKYKGLTYNPDEVDVDEKEGLVMIPMGNDRNLDLPISTFLSGRRTIKFERTCGLNELLRKMGLGDGSDSVDEEVHQPSVQQ